jgi:hypothetical protein
MKWYTHILWGAAAVVWLSRALSAPIDVYSAAAWAALHTVLTDALGHRGLRRARHHDALSLALATALATASGNPALLILGPLHVALDYISPGRWAVSPIYNTLWSTLAIITLVAVMM